MADQLTDLVLGLTELGDVADDPAVFGGQIIPRRPGYTGGDGNPGPMSWLEPQLPVIETVLIAQLIELVGELLPGRFLEERVKRLSDEGLRLGAEEPPGGDIRIANGAVQIGGEVRLGGEVEQLAIFDPLFREGIAAIGQRLTTEPKLLFGESELLDGSEKIIAIISFFWGVGDFHVGQPVLRTQIRIEQIAR